MTNKTDNYTADDIQVLEGLEAVRVRPGMYIGSTSSKGLHHLVWEIVDNSIDEALAGYASVINITVDKDDIVTVTDDGRGMPTEIHPKTGKSTQYYMLEENLVEVPTRFLVVFMGLVPVLSMP